MLVLFSILYVHTHTQARQIHFLENNDVYSTLMY